MSILSEMIEFFGEVEIYSIYSNNVEQGNNEYIITDAKEYYEMADYKQETNKSFILDQYNHSGDRQEYDTFKEAFDKLVEYDEKNVERIVLANLSSPFKFRDMLDSYGYSVYNLAKLTGIPQQTLSRYSTARTHINNMPIVLASKIADVLSIDLDAFWSEVK